MKHLNILSILSCLLLFSFACEVSKMENSNEEREHAYELKTELISIRIAPDTGGRIASFSYQGKEILSQIRDEDNFLWGSTIWPAPQSAWNWPPPKVLDQGQYTLVSKSKKSLVFDSPKDAYRGLQLRKEFSIAGPNAIDIKYTFTNHSDTVTSAGIWEISRIPYEGISTWKTGTIKAHEYSGLTQGDSLSHFQFSDHEEPGKIFIESNGGWVEYRYNGLLFTKEFDIIAAEKVAPEQAPIEIYFDPPRGFAEIEQHAAYIAIAPGESSSFKVRWTLEASE